MSDATSRSPLSRSQSKTIDSPGKLSPIKSDSNLNKRSYCWQNTNFILGKNGFNGLKT